MKPWITPEHGRATWRHHHGKYKKVEASFPLPDWQTIIRWSIDAKKGCEGLPDMELIVISLIPRKGYEILNAQGARMQDGSCWRELDTGVWTPCDPKRDRLAEVMFGA